MPSPLSFLSSFEGQAKCRPGGMSLPLFLHEHVEGTCPTVKHKLFHVLQVVVGFRVFIPWGMCPTKCLSHQTVIESRVCRLQGIATMQLQLNAAMRAKEGRSVEFLGNLRNPSFYCEVAAF